MDDGAAVGIVVRIENQRLERRVGIPFRWPQLMDDAFEDVFDAGALFGRGQNGVVRIQPQVLLDLVRTRSTSAEGRSILLMTGMISRSCSRAR
jgi:hypothetical protein